MSRAMDIGIFLICVSFAGNLFHDANVCYQYGNLAADPLTSAAVCPDEPGVGHPIIAFEMPVLWSYTLKNADNQDIKPGDPSSYQNELNKLTNYNPSPSSVSNIFWIFSWVIIGIRFIVNTLFMPLFGVPFLLQRFWIPIFVTLPIGSILTYIQLVAAYEYLTGKEVFK